MDLQAKKIHFIQEFLRVNSEDLIDKLEKLLHIGTKKFHSEKQKSITTDELNAMINQAEEDSLNGRMTEAKNLKNDIEQWR